MGFPKSVISFGVLAAAASANAAILGYSGTNYLVVDGSRRYSVMDVYIDCSGAFDKCVNYYGQSTSNGWVLSTKNGVTNDKAATSATNGAPWAQGSGSGWMPQVGMASNAWDSFVTIGSRTQDYTASAITGDPYFMNSNATGAAAGVITGGSNSTPAYVGGGWYTANPLDIADLAGTYADKRLMLGRFSIDVTNITATDTLSMNMKGKVTMKVNGTSAGGGTTTQPAFDKVFTYNTFYVPVPTPGALALVGLAGIVSRRRKA